MRYSKNKVITIQLYKVHLMLLDLKWTALKWFNWSHNPNITFIANERGAF